MPLEMRIEADKTVRPFWYGRFKHNGKRQCVNLGVKIQGTPPTSLSLKDQGDAAFEVSRGKAQAALDKVAGEAHDKRAAARLMERAYEINTGDRVKSVKLAALGEQWDMIPRRRKPDDRYAKQCRSTLTRFAEFVMKASPTATDLAHVSRSHAREFLHEESKRNVSAKTWNDTLKLLRATCKYLLPPGSINPFLEMPTKETETVFRIPFTPDELKHIMAAAQDDEFIRPIIVTGVCTAMRRGDCCLLEWKDVDLGKRFITVKTSKTGQTVSIPIFPMLYDELLERSQKILGKPEGFVFPDQAEMYSENPDGITWRVKKILKLGLGNVVEVDAEVTALPQISHDEARQRGEKFIATLPEGDRRTRMAAVFQHYMDGNNIEAVMAETKVSKGSVSGYLNEIEAAIGSRIIRGKTEPSDKKAALQVDREHGLRRASVRDFHSFRVTWVTLALTAGVPLELVQKVTGHKTTDIVLKHYFQPGREAFRAALQTAMPRLLMNGQKSPKEELQELIAKTTAKTLKRNKPRLLKLLEKI